MRTYQHIAFAVLDRYDTLYGRHKSDAGVGSRRRRRFLDLYGFCFSIMLWNVFETAVHDSVVFLVAQKILATFVVYCAYGSAHTFSQVNYIKPSCIIIIIIIIIIIDNRSSIKNCYCLFMRRVVLEICRCSVTLLEPLIAQWYSDALRAEWSGVRVPEGLGIFLSTITSRTVLGPTQPPIQWVPGVLSLGVKQPKRASDRSLSSSAEVKERMELYLYSPIPLHCVVLS
jgi:hypothetical protein